MSLHGIDEQDGGPAGADRLLADAAHAAHGIDARLAAALIDLFLRDADRPSDRARAAMMRMLAVLIADIEGALRGLLVSALGPDAPAALSVPRIPIAAPILERARTLRDGDLVALLLARAEEHRIVTALRRIAAADPDPPQAPVIDDANVALDRALLQAEARRRDDFGEPVLRRADLSAELLHRLAWRIAAALRHYMVEIGALEDITVDDAIADAVRVVLTGHDEGETVEAHAMRLARQLPVSDDRLRAALYDGRLALFAAMLAVRCGIDHESAMLMASDPAGGRLTVLLRAAEVERDVAAMILLEMAAINGSSEAQLGERVDDFAALAPAEARDAIRLWRLDRGYRTAVAELAVGLAASA